MSDARGKTRRERERERHRREILDAARRVVEARGVSGLTVDEVARQAEFAVGSIYRHFRSKEELLEILVEHIAEPLCEEVEALAAETDRAFEDRIHALVSAVLRHFADKMLLIEAYHAVSGPSPVEGSEARQRLSSSRARWVGALEAVLRQGQAAGRVRDGEPRVMASLLMVQVVGWARWSTWGEPTLIADPAATITDLFLRGVGRG
jgi:AcrR family transcriptional regulator